MVRVFLWVADVLIMSVLLFLGGRHLCERLPDGLQKSLPGTVVYIVFVILLLAFSLVLDHKREPVSQFAFSYLLLFMFRIMIVLIVVSIESASIVSAFLEGADSSAFGQCVISILLIAAAYLICPSMLRPSFRRRC